MPRLNKLILLAAIFMGCATSDRDTSKQSRTENTVLFPQLTLHDGEYIEEFKIRVKNGRVSAIRGIPDDWDIAVEWEDGNSVVVRGQARHFSGGLRNFDTFNGAIVVQPGSDTRIQAVVTTDRTDPAGGGGRKIPFRNLALRGQPSSGRRSAASLKPSLHITGTVRDARSGKPIREFRITPRYAFASKTPPVYGAWDEFEGEQFREGKFDLIYDHPLLVGSIEAPGWQFLVEAEGYGPCVTRVISYEENPSMLDCRLNPAGDK